MFFHLKWGWGEWSMDFMVKMNDEVVRRSGLWFEGTGVFQWRRLESQWRMKGGRCGPVTSLETEVTEEAQTGAARGKSWRNTNYFDEQLLHEEVLSSSFTAGLLLRRQRAKKKNRIHSARQHICIFCWKSLAVAESVNFLIPNTSAWIKCVYSKWETVSYITKQHLHWLICTIDTVQNS